MFKTYSKGIIIPIMILVLILIGVIDSGAEAGIDRMKKSGHVQTIVTLENGHQYIVEDCVKEVTVEVYGSPDPRNWKIVDY